LREHGQKPKAYVYVYIDGARRQKKQPFPIGTADGVLLAWIADEKKKYPKAPRSGAGSFAADVDRYLADPTVAAQAGVDESARMLGLWVAALGGERPRASITRDELERVIQGWIAAGLAPATVYHRRTVLMSLYTRLDGRHAANVVRQTTRPKAWTPRDQSRGYATVAGIVEAMPDYSRVSKGIRRLSKAKIVARVMLHTGLRPIDVWNVPGRWAIDWEGATIEIPGTRKGAGGRPRRVPLSPAALAAWRAFDTANMYRAFDRTSASHSFKRAVRRLEGADSETHLYSLRHSVGADAYAVRGDLESVRRLLGHAPGSIVTTQYAMGAHAEVDRSLVEALEARRAASIAGKAAEVPPAVQVMPQVMPKTAKRGKQRRLLRVS
jgi:integrase